MRGHLPVFSGSIGAATGGSSCGVSSVPRASPSSTGWVFSHVRRGHLSLRLLHTCDPQADPTKAPQHTTASRPGPVRVRSRGFNVVAHTGGSWLLSALVSWSSRSPSSLFSVRSMSSCVRTKISDDGTLALASPLTQHVHTQRPSMSQRHAAAASCVRGGQHSTHAASATKNRPILRCRRERVERHGAWPDLHAKRGRKQAARELEWGAPASGGNTRPRPPHRFLPWSRRTAGAVGCTTGPLRPPAYLPAACRAASTGPLLLTARPVAPPVGRACAARPPPLSTAGTLSYRGYRGSIQGTLRGETAAVQTSNILCSSQVLEGKCVRHSSSPVAVR